MVSPSIVSRRILPVALSLAMLATSAAAAQSSGGCEGDSTYRQLDFWVGTWSVYVGDTLVGTNQISKVLRGCAVVEAWRDTGGGEGRSLFYVDPSLHQWKQVWVTDAAAHLGGTKEKHLVSRADGGGVRFQGELRRADGRVILDRTTLTPAGGGQVRQLIEVSTDGGTSWHATFDARYRRAS
jgi:hypothetical protein